MHNCSEHYGEGPECLDIRATLTDEGEVEAVVAEPSRFARDRPLESMRFRPNTT